MAYDGPYTAGAVIQNADSGLTIASYAQVVPLVTKDGSPPLHTYATSLPPYECVQFIDNKNVAIKHIEFVFYYESSASPPALLGQDTYDATGTFNPHFRYNENLCQKFDGYLDKDDGTVYYRANNPVAVRLVAVVYQVDYADGTSWINPSINVLVPPAAVDAP